MATTVLVQSRSSGKERDSETNLDYFGARYYGSTMGRWLSPDWASTPEPVPYADLSDPQSLNLYGYVRNRPLSTLDQNGHCSGDECSQITVKAEVSKSPVLTAGPRSGFRDSARASGEVTYTLTFKGQPLANTDVREDVQSHTTLNGKTIEPKAIIGPGSTDEKGQAKDTVAFGEKVLNINDKGSNAAALDMATSAFKGDVKQVLSFESPSGETCTVTETRTLTNIGPDGKSSSQYRIDLTSPKTQTASPSDSKHKEPI